MMMPNSFLFFFFFFFIISMIIMMNHPTIVSSLACQKICGSQVIEYPFGTGPGCGDPRFQPHVTCNAQQQVLTFATHTGCYPVTSVDYQTQVIYISDPSLSTCSCTRTSPGFGLDSDAPFSFHDDTTVALLGCTGGANSSTPECDALAAPICEILTSCQQPITASKANGLQLSGGCCVYAPVDLGPAFEMDLPELGCTGYSAMYGGGEAAAGGGWKYGIALKYKFNYRNDYPDLCDACEKSNGVCGYSVPYKSFLCNCPGGFNTSSHCFLSSWSNGFTISPQNTGLLVVVIMGLLIMVQNEVGYKL